MSTPASGVLRLTRATVLGGVTVGLSLAAHVAGGGSAPSALGVGVLAVPVLAVTLLVTGRRLSGRSVAGLVAGTQLALHAGLMALVDPVATPGGVVAGGHHLPHLGSVLPVGSVGTAVGSPSASALAMTLAHAVAAGVVALLLTRGEQAVWTLLAWLLPRVPRLVPTHVEAPDRPVGAPATASPAPAARRSRSRAPPALAPTTPPRTGGRVRPRLLLP